MPPRLGYLQLLLRQRDSVGLIRFDDHIRSSVPPRARRGQWRRLIAALAEPGSGKASSAGEALNQAGRLIIDVPLDLHGQSQHLEKNHAHQDADIAVTSEDRFHGSSFKFLVSSFENASFSHSHPKLETRNLKLLLDRDFSQQLEIAEHLARTQHHAAQRIVGD